MKLKTKNSAAVALGKLAAGRKKNFSAAEIERRRKRMIGNKFAVKIKPI